MTNTIADLELIARRIRGRIVEHSHRPGTPHLGGCLSCVDVLVALYFGILDIDPADHRAVGRDRFILGKGHGAPALYQVLSMRGFFPHAGLTESHHDGGGYFGEHPPTPEHMAGIEAATGSLGHGLPIATGMMLGNRLDGLNNRAYVLLGDGECNEGSIWEAAMFAAAQKLDKMTVIVDYNKWQATGRSNEIMALDSLADKWRAFGWQTSEIDGNDMDQVVEALQRVSENSDRPTAIVAHTVKGKGISFMEDDNNWHYRIPTSDEVDAAAQELGLPR